MLALKDCNRTLHVQHQLAMLSSIKLMLRHTHEQRRCGCKACSQRQHGCVDAIHVGVVGNGALDVSALDTCNHRWQQQ